VLTARFEALCAKLSPPARDLLDAVIDKVGQDDYSTAPAAQGHHHAYLRGLVEHSIEVGEIACRIAETEPYGSHIDRNALIVGALLHDVGKVHEYCWQGEPIRFSPEGRLRSHISRGPEIVALATATNRNDLVDAGLNPRVIEVVQHIQESHHGLREWGSPVEPCTLEAVIVHIADLASARLRSMLDDLQSGMPNDAGWVMPPGFRKRPVLTLYPPHRPVSGDDELTESNETAWSTTNPVAEFLVIQSATTLSPCAREDA
jgi:3'-5' exoribonuclease